MSPGKNVSRSMCSQAGLLMAGEEREQEKRTETRKAVILSDLTYMTWLIP